MNKGHMCRVRFYKPKEEGKMVRYIFKRVLMMIPVMLGVILISFVMNRISPGDPARSIAGENASKEAVEELREKMGLNDPWYEQLWNYVKGVVTRFDLGTSYQTKRPVIEELMDRFPTTAKLAFLSIAVSSLVGISLGIISAIKQNTFFDHFCSISALIGVSMPAFWAGLMLILLFAVKLRWLPASGVEGGDSWIMPTFMCSIVCMATITRMTRSSMLEVIRQDYITTARAKGLSEWIVVIKHALKNALIPIITVLGIQLGMLLGGAVLTETVFSVPGIGKYMVDSIKFRDYPVVQGGVLLLALVFSVVNLLVDILYAYVDPRVKSMYDRGKKRKPRKRNVFVKNSENPAN